MWDKIKKYYKDWLFMTLGVAIAGAGYSFFIMPNNIVTGGVSGLGVLFQNIFDGFNPALTILILNIALLVLGLFFVGKEFFLKTVYGSLTFPLFIELFSLLYNVIPSEYLDFDLPLIVIFSSIIIGYGLGLSIKHGGSTGGTEILQKIMFKYLHVPFSISLYLIDGAIILIGLFVVKNVQTSLYAIVFTFVAGMVIDSVVFSGFNKRAVYIISNKNEEIKDSLLDMFDRGVTSIRVVGEYSKTERQMLVCVLSSNEYYKLREVIEKCDPKAFYYAVRASEVRGEGFSYEKRYNHQRG